jgi:predicted transcriptional regulator
MKPEFSAKLKTYLAQLDNGNIDNKHIEILSYIKQNPNIDTDRLRDELKMAHQSLTACVSNLLDIGIIMIVGQTEKEETNYSKYLYVEDEPTIIKNQRERHYKKFQQWVKRGLKDFVEFIDEKTLNQLIKEKEETIEQKPDIEFLDTNEDFEKFYSQQNYKQGKLF